MCSINGVTGKREALVRAMNDATRHRGPDATSVWTEGRVTFGANRLAVIDLSETANQPMHSPDGRYSIVFNGEIYNFRELRRDLEKNHVFRTEGDTEVLLALFVRDGVEAFARLNGMFALAIWDRKKEELILARDHSGIKPLYYRVHEGTLTFSSEVKGILADATIERKVNREALELYLRLRYVPEPFSMIQGIEKLPPASYAIFKHGKLDIHTFYTPELKPLLKLRRDDAEATTRTLVDASVRRQLVSDRPIGVFLSGGLDSTIVLDAAIRAGGRPETFSLAFALSEHEQAEKFNADARIAAVTAQHYGTRHQEITLDENTFIASLPDAVRFLDQPLANATAVAQYVLAKESRKRIVVALQGDGGDELFGGYPRYRLSLLMDRYQRVPSIVRRLAGSLHPKLAKMNLMRGIDRVALFHFEKEELLKRAVASEYVSTRPQAWFENQYLQNRNETDFTQLLMDVDRRSWLVDEALARTDTMTMGASLEARVPLLDPDIVSFVSRLPTSMRVDLFTNKKLLRDAFKARLPHHIFQEKKRGFFSPTAKWLRRPHMLALAREVLSPGYHAGSDDILAPDVLTLLEQHVAGSYAMNTLWTLISFRLWAKEFDATL